MLLFTSGGTPCRAELTGCSAALSFTQDIKKSLPSGVDTVIVETDGTWRSEDNKHGNAAKVLQAKAASASRHASESVPPSSRQNGGGYGGAAGGSGSHRDGSLASSSKAGTPLDTKPDLEGLTGQDKGKQEARAEIIDLDEEDDDDDDYGGRGHGHSNGDSNGSGNGNGWAPPPRPSASAAAPPSVKRAGAGAVIDLTLSDSGEDDNEGEDEDDRPIISRRLQLASQSASNKRRVDSDWEDGPSSGGHQRARYA